MAVSEFSDVFVSYRRKNVDFTKEVVEALRKQDKEVWVDWEDIPPGSVGFTDDIQKGIEGADTFICILSPDYMESEYCIMELDHAIAMNKKLIPIVHKKFDDYPVPSGIGHINWIYFTPHAGQENTFEESFPKVMDAMDTDLEHVRYHKRLLIRALEWQSNNRESGFLLMGTELEEASRWLIEGANKEPHPTELQMEYVESGHEFTERRQRMILTGVSIALVVSVILTILSGIFYFQAETARYITNVRLLASRLPAISANDPFVARSIAEGMLELDNIPLVAEAAAQDNVLNSAAVRLFSGHDDIVSDIEFVNGDARFVTASGDGTLRLWESATNETLQIFEGGYDAGVGVRSVAIFPDGTRMLSGGTDGKIVEWDIATGEILSEFTEHSADVYSIKILTDGISVISGDTDGNLYLWNIESRTIGQTFTGHDGGILDIAVNNEASLMVTGMNDGLVLVWDIESGEIIRRLRRHTGEVYGVDINDDATLIASSSADNNIYLWDISSEETTVERFVGHVDEVWDVAFTHAENHLISISGDRTVRIWDFDNPTVPRILTGHSGWGNTLSIAEGDVMLVTGADDNAAILWDFQRSSMIAEYHPDGSRVLSITLSPDESIVATGSVSGRITFINTGTGEQSDPLQESESRAEAVVFSPDGQFLFSGHCKNPDEFPCTVGEVLRWDVETQTVIERMDIHSGLLTDMDAGSNEAFGDFIVSSATENTAIIWSVETGEEIGRFEGHTDAIDGLEVSPDGTQLLTASRDGLVILWSISDQRIIQQFEGHRDWVSDVAWFADGRHAMSTSWDGTLIYWDTQAENSDDALLRVFEGHQGGVMEVAIPENGETVLSGARDGVVLLWDVATGEPIRVLNGHGDDVVGLEWVDNDVRAYSSSYDGTVRYWHVFLSDSETADEATNSVVHVDICEGLVQGESIAQQYNVPQLCGSYFERFMARFNG